MKSWCNIRIDTRNVVLRRSSKAKDHGRSFLVSDETEEDVVDVASWEDKLESGAIAKETYGLLLMSKRYLVFLSNTHGNLPKGYFETR